MRAMMARTVVNGCTEAEEQAAARMIARYVEAIDRLTGASPAPQANWAHAERESPEYKALLEKHTLESLLKAAVRELALERVNAVSPPHRKVPGEPMERVSAREILQPYLAMALCPGGTHQAVDILFGAIDELIYEGMLPEYLSIPRGE